MLFSQTLFAEIIPQDRRIVWANNVGIPGGIPNRTTIFTNLTGIDSTGANDVSAQIQAALNNCPVGQVVYLPAGTYRINSSLQVTKGITFRGAGPTRTILRGTIADRNGIVTITSSVLNGQSSRAAIIAGATKGSTNITLAASDTNLRPGYIVVVNQLNDESFVINDASVGGHRNDTDATGTGTRNNAQSVEVKSVNGPNLVVWPPLIWNFGNSPEIYYRRANSATNNYVQYAGVEDMCLRNVNPDITSDFNLYFNRSAFCWAKNVRTEDAATAHLQIMNSFRFEIRHCTFSNSVNTASSYGYGIAVDYQACSGLIEDNIFIKTRDFVKCNSGSSGNAIIYNYHTNAIANPAVPGFAVHSGGTHSAHPMMNLFEGNITYKIVFDFYWGSSSHQTVARNWFRGPMPYAHQSGAAIILDQAVTSYNIVGNVLGYSGINSNPKWTTRYATRISPQSHPYEYSYATFRVGYYSDGDDGGGNDASGQWANYIVAGNFDYVTQTQAWHNPTAPEAIPNSYLYGGKPSYFGPLAWPPIDPVGPTAGETAIPAGYRHVYGVDPGAVGVNLPPTAMANATPASGNAPLSVAFSSAGSSDPEGAGLSYNWTFGDGTSSSAANPNHTYSTVGSYVVRVSVSDGTNTATSGDVSITVTSGGGGSTIPGHALVDFETASEGAVVTPGILASSTKGAVSGTWYTTTDPEQIMDGQGTTTNLKITTNASQHLYTPANINGTVYGGSGTRGMRATLAVNNAALFTFAQPYPSTLSVGFYFRFNGPAINSAPRDLLDFNDLGGNFQIFQIYDQPGNPYFHTHFQSGAGVGNNVSFSRNKWYWVSILRAAANGTMQISFYDPANSFALVGTSTGRINSSTGPVRWMWFGCSKYSSGGSQSVDYDNLIINTNGVFPLGPGPGGGFPNNQSPTVVANGSPLSGVPPLAVTFSSAGSSDPEGAALTYNWNFGDGSPNSTVPNPNHTYGTAGSYFARLTVSDGTNSVTSSSINIRVGNQPPVVIANANPRSGPAPLAVAFSSAGSSDPENTPLAYSWIFGDGTAGSTAASPSHVYQTNGVYIAQLTVSDGVNSVSTNFTITVSSGLVAAYDFNAGTGTTVVDASGNGNNGSITGGAAWATVGRFGKALSFDGADGVVAIPDNIALDLAESFTLEAWVYPTSLNGDYQSIIVKPMDSAFSAVSYALHGGTRPSGTPAAVFSGSGNSVFAPTNLLLNTWSHMAATYDGATMRLYVNGSQVASRVESDPIASSGESLRIGFAWIGLIDEVRIYNRALPAAEIQSDMNKPVGVPRPAPPGGVRVVAQ